MCVTKRQSKSYMWYCNGGERVRDGMKKSVIREKVSSTFANTDTTSGCCWSAESHKSFVAGLEHTQCSISDNVNLIWQGQDGKLLPSPCTGGSWWYLMKVLSFPFIQVTVLSRSNSISIIEKKELSGGVIEVCLFPILYSQLRHRIRKMSVMLCSLQAPSLQRWFDKWR